MKNGVRGLFILFCIYIFGLLQSPVEAASLKFDKTTVAPAANTVFTVDVVVDAGADQITSADVWMVYDPSYLEAQTVTAGTLFPAVTNNITSGKVSITGLIVDPGNSKTGVGTIATVSFKALKTGSTSVTYDCRAEVSNSSKIIKNDVNATNIIDCNANQKLTVSIGGAGAVVPTTPSGSTNPPQTYPTTPASLPESGIVENINRFAVPGLLLLMIGGLIKLFIL